MPLLVLLALLLAIPASGQTDALAAASRLIDQQQYAEALKILVEYADKNPKDASAQFNLGLVHSLMLSDSKAVLFYRRALELQPGLTEAEWNLAQVYFRQKQYSDALPLLSSVVEKKPKDARPLLLLADCNLSVGRYAEAEQAYRRASELDYTGTEALIGLGRSRQLQKKGREAAEAFAIAAQRAPNDRSILAELGAAYEQANMTAEAIGVYRGMLNDPAARARLGVLLMDAGQIQESIEHLEYAHGLDPSPANKLVLGLAYLKNKKPGASLPLVEEALKASPDSLALRMLYGRILRDLKRYEEAALEFQKVVNAKVDHGEGWSELAGMLLVLKRFEPALVALERLKELQGENAAYFYFRATALDATKQSKLALESYQKFLSLSKDQNPDEEFKARQRIRVLQKVLGK